MESGSEGKWEEKTQASGEGHASVGETSTGRMLPMDLDEIHADGTPPHRLPVIVALRGGAELRQLWLTNDVMDIGRSKDAHIVVDDSKCSRIHARITWENPESQAEYPRCHIEDCCSHNGTFLNHRRIGADQLLDGDRILVGTTVLGFYVRDAALRTTGNLVVHANSLDSLTGLSNRLGFEEQSHRYTLLARRHQRPVCLSLLDIDLFAELNSRAGSLVGDLVIRHTADIIRSTLRQTDLAARTGGDRFALLWPETPLNEAIIATERLRSAIKAKGITVHGGPLPLTFSGGVVQLGARHHSWNELYDEADAVVATAKRAGRDQVVSAPREA